MQVGELRGERGRNNGVRALNDVIDNKLLASPQNYELWLHYQQNWNPSLTREIDKFLDAGKALDEGTTETLYDKYINNRKFDSAVIDTGARLANELAEALKALKAAGHRTEAFSENLDVAAGELDTGRLNSAQLMNLIRSLSDATKAMSRENAELTKRLESSSSEVEDLRNHLQQARAESLTDALTGLANRRLFEETLRLRMNESKNLNYPLALAICDIDHFKKFNDTWGHQTGDQVIRFVGSILNSFTLDDQLVARYGGEEFVIVMPRFTLSEAENLLKQIRHSVEVKQLKRKSTDENLGHVTISIGATEYRDGESSTTFIKRADEMLYAAKRGGRNQVVTSVPEKYQAA